MEDNNKIYQPHDKYAKSILSRVEVAKSLIQSRLPKELVKRIDMDSLQLTNKSFVSEQMKAFHSDVIYKCNIDNNQGYIYHQIEHQSTPDEELPLRILEYNIQLMRQHFNEGNKKLPIIINEVIYAGITSPYPYSTDIFDMFENSELAREIMFKPPNMTDLTTKTQEELAKEGLSGLMGVMIKQGIFRDHLNWIKENTQLFCSIVDSPFGDISIYYILATDEVNSPEQLKEAILNAAPNKKETVMTAELKIEERGMERGKLETAKNMLADNFNIEIISKMTGLPADQINSL